ncbi:MAG: YjjG family noncanonical pyrimidine nucleotidase [Bacteroidota bacterium]
MKAAKHIFFDLDHTLWDFEKNSREAILHLFLEYKFDVTFKTDFETFIGVYENINHHLWQLYALQQVSKEELRYQRFYKTFLHFNFDRIDVAKLWADEYLTISPYKTHLIEGTFDILNYLKEKNYVLHIITNGFKEVQHIKLTQSKLKDFFRHIIISEDHGFNKPDIRIFELAQELSGANTAECVMIGDNYENDIVGALNANWKAVHLSEKPQQNSDVNFYRIGTLPELKNLL